ncbi:MAG: sensor histidine kinase [Anaerolineae bacterium]|nr:sensor histidine kinase [Anaerolineae bacterium]
MWSLVLYVALIFATIVFWREEGVTSAQKWQMGSLAVVFAAWHAAFIYYFNRRQVDIYAMRHPWPILIYLAVLITLWFVMTLSDPVFNYILFGLGAQVFGYIHLRWSIPISLILTGLVAYLQVRHSDVATLSPDNPGLWYFFLISVGSIVLALFISGIISQSSQRRELIEQLQAAQSELAAAERREGILQERERLAREIHDTLAQGFISIITHLEASEQNLSENVAQSHHHLTQAKDMARRGVNQARRVVQDLRPEVLEKSPLPEAIERVVQGWAKQSGIQAQTTITGTHNHLHPEAETTLIRAVQEALANVQKHAQASSAQVTLSYMGDVLMLDVQDNGIGLDSAPPPSTGGGYGLTAMRQRVTQVGGSLTVESEPGEGTTVVVQVPIQQMTQRAAHNSGGLS